MKPMTRKLHLRWLATVLVFLCFCSVAGASSKPKKTQLKTSDGREIYGIVIAELDSNSTQFEEEQQWQWAKFNAKSPLTVNTVFKNTAFANYAGSAVFNNHLHVTNYYAPYEGYGYVTLYDFDLANPDAEPGYQSMYGNLNVMACDLAYRKSNGKVYGFFWDGSKATSDEDTTQYIFGTLDYKNATFNTINAKNDNIYYIALTFDSQDRLWGLDANGNLWNINTETGNVVGGAHVLNFPTQPAQFFQSMTCDERTGCLYYAGIDVNHKSALYKIDLTDYSVAKVSDIPNDYEIVGLYIPDVTTNDNAPAGISDLTLQFANGACDGKAVFTLPSETFAGQPIKGNVDYAVLADSDTIATGSGAAGSRVEAAISVTNGWHKFSVVTASNHLQSPESEQQKLWVGTDTPVKPAFAEVQLNGNKASLTWASVKQGVNGGYVNPAEVTYTVTRYPDSSAVASHLTDTTYTSVLPDGVLTNYRFAVQAEFKGKVSDTTRTATVQYGDAFSVPYSEDFSDDSHFDLFTVIDRGGQGTWVNSYHKTRIFHFSGQSDDWLITPPIKMQAGVEYEVQCSASPGYTSNPDSLQILIGSDVNPDHFKPVTNGVRVNQDNQNVSGTYSVEADGNYRLAFRSLGNENSYGIILDDIKVTAKTMMTAPDSVANLKAVAADSARLGATLSFTAPVNDLSGNKLKNISDIKVYRDSTLISTLKAEPGQQLTVADDEPHNGYNTWRVIVSNGNNSPVASTTAYVGMDIPDVPQQVKLTDNFDGTATLTWDAPSTRGARGFYVDARQLTYTIYNANGTTVDSLLTTQAHKFVVPQNGDQTVNYYLVAARSVAGTGNAARSNVVYGGTADELPISDSFSGGNFNYKHWGSENSANYNYFSTMSDYTADNDWGAMTWTAYQKGEQAWLRTGKLHVTDDKDDRRVGVYFQYYAEPGKDLTLDVYADLATRDTAMLYHTDYKKLEGADGWRKVVVYLPQKAFQAPYCLINFKFTANETGVPGVLDDINIRKVNRYDLTPALTAPASLVLHTPSDYQVTVENRGYATMNSADYKVSLQTARGEAASTQGVTLEPNTMHTFKLPFTAQLADGNTVSLFAQVDVNSDLPEWDDDNCTPEVNYDVHEPQLPTVANLKLNEPNAGAVTLQWQAPASLTYTRTEDFENVLPWQTDSVNGFTTFDGDKLPTNSWTLMTYPHMGEPFAWILMNGNQIKLDKSQAGFGMGHNSAQAMHAVSNVHDYLSFDANSDDWLISPELSGKAQTISFWANSEGPNPEDFAVYTSTSLPDTASLNNNRLAFVKFTPCAWTQYSYELPEGTKYFAIVFTSNLTGLAIDDITYQGKALTLNGYNIYRDGKQVATVPAATTTWTDNGVVGDHVYMVSAVYTEGESSTQKVSTALAVFSINGEQNRVTAGNASLDFYCTASQQVAVYTVSGQLMFSGVVKGNQHVALPAGEYIVKMGKRSVNMLVR